MRVQHLFLALIALLIVGAWVVLIRGQAEPDQLRARAERLLQQGDARQTLKVADQLLSQQPASPAGRLIKGLAHFQLHDCRNAEIALQDALIANPQLLEAHQKLILLYKSQGRFWELKPHALVLLRSGDSGSEFLIPLAAPDELALSDVEFQFAAACMQSNADATLQLGTARTLLQNGQLEEAVDILHHILSDAPQLIEAHCMLGLALFQSDDATGLGSWHESLPLEAEEHPEIWWLRGEQCLTLDELPEALRCFSESLARDPNHRRANFAMGNALKRTQQHELSAALIHRAKLLEEVSRLATRGDDRSGGAMNAPTLYRIGELMQELGRLPEAAAWYRQALRRQASPQTQQALDAVLQQLSDDTPLTLASANPVVDFDRAKYPLPSDKLFALQRSQPNMSTDNDITFRDQAQRVGLNFRFHNGANAADDIARMFEFCGGGISVLDFDADSWPDIYFTQGGDFPFETSIEQDQLFRNLSGNKFDNVSAQCGLGDMRYSQGAAIGDYNNDGFPDLYLGNIGANRLYHNHGDGTFSEATTLVVADQSWTSGCALVDVNNDSLPDIYSLNYLAGQDVLSRRCDRGGEPVQCPLHLFPGAQDRLYINNGDGRFVESTQSAGIVLSEGKGLGIIAAMSSPNGPMSLFCANDDTPNFFFVPTASGPEFELPFVNRAIETGLAFGAHGVSQSCMGVAAGDVNHDGRLDLFVTNYANEPANLFLQTVDGAFEDVANRFGLHQATLNPMGWGTQFLDADLDGWLDLVAVNGHLDANTAMPLQYKMKPQCFHNQSGQRFHEVPGNRLGPYFAKAHAGRAVARLDWDRDGAEDLCISHADEPVVLLHNTTSSKGNYLVLHLRGTQVARDAVGAIVKLTRGQDARHAFHCAGDGFQASNEKKLVIGLGTWSTVDKLVVYWPGGNRQSCMTVPINAELLVVEGNDPLRLPSPN